jgi:AcrR family transcriptional regulator
VPRRGLSTDAIIARAAAIADREGLEAVTLTRLAADFGVKPPSLYKHVAGLDEVHRALALRGLGEANARLQQAIAGKARDEALFALAHAYWRFSHDSPGLYAASLRSARHGENDVAALSDALANTVLAVLAGYGLGGDDALHAARGFRAIVHGFVSLDAAGGFRLKRDLAASLDRLLRAFADGLAARAARAA